MGNGGGEGWGGGGGGCQVFVIFAFHGLFGFPDRAA